MNTHDIPFKDYDHAEKMRHGFSFTIDSEGRWYCHDSGMGAGPIYRDALSKLLAGAGTGFMAGKGLRLDPDGRYRMTSPPDTYDVDVEDVPFLITAFEHIEDRITLVTNFEERVVLDHANTFQFRANGPYPEIPYINVRKGLLARLSRNVYYDLCNLALANGDKPVLHSFGATHILTPEQA